MIDISDIIFKKTNMTLEERTLYAFLLTQRAINKEAVDCNIIESNSVTEEGLYYTVHSNQELMELLGCGKTKLIQVKKSLEKRGLLKQKRVLDGSNKYFTFNKEVI